VPNHIGYGIEFRQAANFIHIPQRNHSIRTKAFSLCSLTATNACNHMSAVLFRNMDGRSTDTSDRTRNEYDFACPWPNCVFRSMWAPDSV
jgi:hypothetical protein